VQGLGVKGLGFFTICRTGLRFYGGGGLRFSTIFPNGFCPFLRVRTLPSFVTKALIIIIKMASQQNERPLEFH